jgi:hypothetical protein
VFQYIFGDADHISFLAFLNRASCILVSGIEKTGPASLLEMLDSASVISPLVYRAPTARHPEFVSPLELMPLIELEAEGDAIAIESNYELCILLSNGGFWPDMADDVAYHIAK